MYTIRITRQAIWVLNHTLPPPFKHVSLLANITEQNDARREMSPTLIRMIFARHKYIILHTNKTIVHMVSALNMVS